MERDILASIREMEVLEIEHDDDGLVINIKTKNGGISFYASDELTRLLLKELKDQAASPEPAEHCENEGDRQDIQDGYNDAIRKIENCIYEDVQTEELEEIISCQTSICDRKGGRKDGEENRAKELRHE
jgi:hypothetical protein